jgi:alpha-tubulin suppressor-like RCC1 family protein
MKRRDLRTAWRGAAGLLLLVASLLASSAGAQNWLEAEERIKRLVAMVGTNLAGEARLGAALVVGAEGDDVFLATADHLVRQGKSTATRIEVRFYGRRDDAPVTAELLPPHSPPGELDLAVLRIAGAAQVLDLGSLPFDQLSARGELKRGGDVYLLGNPLGKAWRINIDPERVAAVEGDLVEFESILIAPGHSGGALLDERRRLVGMLRSDEPPYGEAVAVGRVMDTLLEWGFPVFLSLPGAQVAAGGQRTCRVEANGAAVCWGNHGDPFLYIDPAPAPIDPLRFRAISVGLLHVCGVDREGHAYCWGSNNAGQGGTGETTEIKEGVTPEVAGSLSFSSVSAGGWHACGLTGEGRAYCWGSNGTGQLGNGSDSDSARPASIAGGLELRSLSAGLRHTCGVSFSGQAWCWGGVLGTGKPWYGMDPPEGSTPVAVAEDLRFTSISAGNALTCALTEEGEAWCWGSGEAAPVGVDAWDRRERVVPVAVPGRLRFRSISAGLGEHACGLSPNGAAYCWGANESGQLGNGTKRTSYMPVPVAGGRRFKSISAGAYHTCGVATDGSTCCWGSNRAGAVWRDADDDLSEPLCLDERRHPGVVATTHWRDAALPLTSAPPRAGSSDRLDSFDAVAVPEAPQSILARHLQALGGKTKLEAIQSREAVGTIEFPLFGIGGRVTILQKSPDKWRSTVVLEWHEHDGSTYRTESYEFGFNGSLGWKQDPEGKVTFLEGPDLEEVRRAFGIYPELGWGSEQSVLRGRTRLGERELLVVETSSARDGTIMLYLDEQSGLLAYSLLDLGRADGGVRIETYHDDYRDVGGVLVPFSMRVADSGGTALLSFEQIRHGVEIPDNVFDPPEKPQPGASD